jgi:ribosomal protein S18 acetylase RimI-like enzyme
MIFRKACSEDINPIVELVNKAYRSGEGWTNEASLVSGNRTSKDEVLSYINNAHLFVLEKEEIISVICIEEQDGIAYIGFLAVNTKFQNQGLGKLMLEKAEEYALKILGLSSFVMAVVSDREELIDFYLRRGYEKTGKIVKYPTNLNVGTPKKNLHVIYLSKKIK